MPPRRHSADEVDDFRPRRAFALIEASGMMQVELLAMPTPGDDSSGGFDASIFDIYRRAGLARVTIRYARQSVQPSTSRHDFRPLTARKGTLRCVSDLMQH